MGATYVCEAILFLALTAVSSALGHTPFVEPCNNRPKNGSLTKLNNPLESWVLTHANNVSVVYMRQATCAGRSTGPQVKAQMFSFCYYWDAVMFCMGLNHEIIFPNCSGKVCSLLFPPEAYQCLNVALNTEPSDPDSMCDLILNDPDALPNREEQDWITAGWGHLDTPACYAAWPLGTKFVREISCINHKPQLTLEMHMSQSFGEGNFSCMMATRCYKPTDTMYMMCAEKKPGCRFPSLACLEGEFLSDDDSEKRANVSNGVDPFDFDSVTKEVSSTKQNDSGGGLDAVEISLQGSTSNDGSHFKASYGLYIAALFLSFIIVVIF